MFVVVVPVVASIVLEASEPEAWRAGLGSAVHCGGCMWRLELGSRQGNFSTLRSEL